MSSYSFRHFLICISGFSGSGKDEFSRHFVEDLRAPRVGLADPAKRHMADLYGFTEYQLFGPSAARNWGDLRYPKPEFEKLKLVISDVKVSDLPSGLVGELKDGIPYWEFDGRGDGLPPGLFPYVPGKLGAARHFVPEGHPAFWLSPREALQRYCELMNIMYSDTWIRKSVNIHMQLGQTVEHGGSRVMVHAYDRMQGLIRPDGDNAISAPEDGGSFFSCSADFRHVHEFRLAKKFSSRDFVPVTVRVKRPSIPSPPFDHRSETEQATIPDSAFDFVVDNSGTVEDLRRLAAGVAEAAQQPGWEPKGWTL